jgi:hypothetical protein
VTQYRKGAIYSRALGARDYCGITPSGLWAAGTCSALPGPLAHEEFLRRFLQHKPTGI